MLYIIIILSIVCGSFFNFIITDRSDLLPVFISVVDWHSLGLELGLEKYQLDIIDNDR